MENTLGVRSSLNAKGKKQTRKALVMTRVQASNLGRYITVAMGCGIPLLSLSLSHLGGSLLACGTWATTFLGVFAFGLCVAVLGVSLSHLAWAIGDITKSPRWASVALAISVDCSLLVGELIGVFGADAGVERLRIGLMIAVTVSSAVLNTWAFFGAPKTH